MTTQVESPTITACRLALRAARERTDCDMIPRITEVDVPDERWDEIERRYRVAVDVQYARSGYRALYGLHAATGEIHCWQD